MLIELKSLKLQNLMKKDKPYKKNLINIGFFF